MEILHQNYYFVVVKKMNGFDNINECFGGL